MTDILKDVLDELDTKIKIYNTDWISDGKFQLGLNMKPILEKAINLAIHKTEVKCDKEATDAIIKISNTSFENGKSVETQRIKTLIEDEHLWFKERYDLEKEFLEWAKEHNAKVCPMNVISWIVPKFKVRVLSKISEATR